MTRLLIALALVLSAAWPAHAQTGGTLAGVSAVNALPVQGVTGGVAMPVSGTFSATIGGFAPASQGTPITATTAGVTGTLPAGMVVVATNAGTTNTAYCALGASATTSAQPIAPNGGWFSFTVGASTQLTCATSTGTTTVNMIGGAGIATGTGGGGGGAGGGGGTSSGFGSAFPTQGTAIGISNGTNMVALLEGTQAIGNSLSVTPATSSTWPISAASLPLPTGASTSALQTTANTNLTTINTTLGSPFQAGASIGNTSFGISGTLPAFAATPAFTISGTLPAFAATPTVNLGTLNGVALAANQTNASQKTQIVDGGGNVIAATSNSLNVQCANCSGSGVSTADGTTFTAGSSLFAGTGGFYQTTVTSNPLTAGNQGMLQLTHYRAAMTDWFNSSGVEMGTAATPVQVSLTNTGSNATSVNVQALQSNAANLKAQVVGTGTFAVQLTGTTNNINNISGTISLPTGAAQDSTVATGNSSLATIVTNTALTAAGVTATSGSPVQGMTGGLPFGIVGHAGGVLDAVGQNITAPGNEIIVGGQFNTAPSTISNGNVSPLQMDAAANLLVNSPTIGAIGDGIWPGSGNGTVEARLGAIYTAAIQPIVISQVTPGTTNGVVVTTPIDIDQTTPGTTNGVQLTGAAAPNAVAQGSTTAGQTGSLAMAAVGLNYPGYGSSTITEPINEDLNGSLRTVRRVTLSTQTPTVTSNGTYANEVEIGGLMTFPTNSVVGTLNNVRVTSKSILGAQLKLYLFNTQPTVTTWADHTTVAINTADIIDLFAVVDLTTPDSFLGTMTIWNAGNLGFNFFAGNGNIYGVLVAVGQAVLTSASTSDITVQAGIIQ